MFLESITLIREKLITVTTLKKDKKIALKTLNVGEVLRRINFFFVMYRTWKHYTPFSLLPDTVVSLMANDITDFHSGLWYSSKICNGLMATFITLS